jgi:hypothetical protein
LKPGQSVELEDLGLYTGDSGTGVLGGKNPSEADNLIVVAPNGMTTRYFYLDLPGYEGWYDARYRLADHDQIGPGTAFFMYRKAGQPGFVWQRPGD